MRSPEIVLTASSSEASEYLYLDFTGYKRSKRQMNAPVNEIIPGFKSVREHGLNMIDASQLTFLTAKAEAASTGGW